ncbi:MAG TPA: glucosidase [Phycisphaerales bacterium]|nr:glucosidase [Phycisphaerales bacterium]HMP38429.1 glucosidase [Phycisphaerales bacterium]
MIDPTTPTDAGAAANPAPEPTPPPAADPECARLAENARRERFWKRWGAYLPSRQWGTVREDYSADGDCWNSFPHDHARSRTYRWGEDGILGLTDRYGVLCFAPTLWNGRDPILKERFFGLTNQEGNHGEDVKECYWHLDATPTGSWMKALYRYPHAAYPYDQIVAENRRRTKLDPEYELLDTGVLDDGRFFDLFVEYAKASPDDILIRLTVANRGPEPATLHLLPTLWFRNTWAWGRTSDGYWPKGSLSAHPQGGVAIEHVALGRFRWFIEAASDGTAPKLVWTENETNTLRHGGTGDDRRKKDAFHLWLVEGRDDALSKEPRGTKVAAAYRLEVPAGGEVVLRARLVQESEAGGEPFGKAFDECFATRIAEADAFYETRISHRLAPEQRRISRLAYAGLLWSKQFYNYVVSEWLDGDPTQPPPPPSRAAVRNADWRHLFNRDIISMPDTWEYPWYAAWDLAFQLVAMSSVDHDFAESQLILFLREWYMHPAGQLPAYEFAFGDSNPPVHAWAAFVVHSMASMHGRGDRIFLERCFQKLLINFTWWVNRKDTRGRNLFAGGFLGLDNIGIFDRSHPPPGDFVLDQADGTAWMAFYCLVMLGIALELADQSPAYEDVASKFFEHFVAIADAINGFAGTGLWDEEDGFYYDAVEVGGSRQLLRTRSIVGLLPIIAFGVLPRRIIERLPDFSRRMRWFLENRADLGESITYCASKEHVMMLALASRPRLERVLRYLLDENEFLSPHGIRALSRYHLEHPFIVHADGHELRVDYEPGESTSSMFGGNSNWRGPIWFPVNFLLIRALNRYHDFYGETFRIECPTGSGTMMTLREVARELARRITGLFLPDATGRRPCHGDRTRFATDPLWKDLVHFHEYFHGDDGRGLGAEHQTGWTALVATLLEEFCAHDPRSL